LIGRAHGEQRLTVKHNGQGNEYGISQLSTHLISISASIVTMESTQAFVTNTNYNILELPEILLPLFQEYCE
jgi:hypothetical protein